MQALRAQALGQLKSGELSPGTKSISFCCCNDVIAPPIWTLLLVHCPSYLKQLWALNTEAKLVSRYVKMCQISIAAHDLSRLFVLCSIAVHAVE
jgi:hypothetical protein